MKIGVIGTGNLAEAMIRIFLKNRSVTSSEISVYDIDTNKLNYWAGTYDVIPCSDLDTVVQNSHILFIAVNGKEFQKLIPNVDFLLKTYRPLVVSLASGKTLEDIEDLMDFITPMARVMTNLNIGTGSGITAYCFNELATEEQKGTLIELFSATGQLVEIEERYFDAFAAVSATASAFSCALIDTLCDCGISSGLGREVALKTVLQSVLGTTKSLIDLNMDVYTMTQKLCPPSSMTMDGLLTLKGEGFDRSVINGYKAAFENKN